MCKVVKLAYRKRIFVNLRNKFQFSNKVTQRKYEIFKNI